MSETTFLAKEWTYKKKKNLPNSSFAYVDPQGKGHFPYKDENGKLDEAHINNAFSRLPQSNLSMDIKKKIHTKLVNACKQLGKEHNNCSIPGCEGYTPASQKSFLESGSTFSALSEEAMSLQSDWTKFDQKRAKGGKKTKSAAPKSTTKKTKSTSKKKTGKTKTKKPKVEKTKKTRKKSLLEEPTSFLKLASEFDQIKREAGL